MLKQVQHDNKNMCRFLLAKFEQPENPQKLLEKFADMAEKSKALDGDWQGDGWGMRWKDEHDVFHEYFSLLPIWKDKEKFKLATSTNHVLVHARSASFPHQKGIIEYNQPYVDGPYSFVFNGLLKGVSFPKPVLGMIGAQKIWTIMKEYLQLDTPGEALAHTVDDLKQYTTNIHALNIGLSDGTSCWVYNQYAQYPDYYGLYQYQGNGLTFIVSEPLKGFQSQPIHKETVTNF